jgi:acyl-CoA thioesterase FadM
MSDDADEVYARISIVSVRFDTAARKSVPIDDTLRAVLRNLGTKEAA